MTPFEEQLMRENAANIFEMFRLTARVDELLNANTALVMKNRELQDELAKAKDFPARLRAVEQGIENLKDRTDVFSVIGFGRT